MKRFSFDWETVGMGAGVAETINDDGAEQEVRAHAVYVQTWAIRDNQTAQVIAACHDALSAQMIVDDLNTRVDHLRDPVVTRRPDENPQQAEDKEQSAPKSADF